MHFHQTLIMGGPAAVIGLGALAFLLRPKKADAKTVSVTIGKPQPIGTTMEFRPGIRTNWTNAISAVLPIIERVHKQVVSRSAIVSSGFRPGDSGLHGTGNAIDLATSDLTDTQAAALTARLKSELGPSYDVVNEHKRTSSRWTGPHIHIEFDPK